MMGNQSDSRKTALWWIRRDLRLQHNQALQAALSEGYQVQPVYILDPNLLSSSRMGQARKDFLFQGLDRLQEQIARQGGQLIVRSGNPKTALESLVRESAAAQIFAEQDLSPYARQRDQGVSRRMPLQLISGLTIADPEEIKTAVGTPYQVYSPYRKKWKQRYLSRIRRGSDQELEGRFWDQNLGSERIPALEKPQALEAWQAGEEPARQRLSQFVEGDSPPIYRYQENRNRPDREGTSGLSPYLHFGMISIREVFQAALSAMDRARSGAELQSAESWLDELIWREFYLAILYHHPDVLKKSYRENLQEISWRNHQESFQRWKQGLTGFPIVDAGMRQLLATHWMHNRVRMITASFLVKDLLIDWRWGEEWFMKSLVDADLASNNGGWQWVAGTGTDAAPYFRIFNPTTQAKKHDPQGGYIRRYLPELAQVPDDYIHTPWRMPDSLQQKAGCRIGKDYPEPIVDHQKARKQTLEAYQIARDSFQEEAGA